MVQEATVMTFSYFCNMIFVEVFLIAIGMAFVLWGADRFTDAASDIARYYNVSEMIIGLTIVGLGTSLPEFMVSLLSALRGSGEMSIGNVVGSNVFNALCIVGASSLLLPLNIPRRVLYTDVLITLGVTVIVVCMGHEGFLSRWDGSVLFMLYLAYIAWNIREARRHDVHNERDTTESPRTWRIVMWLVVGVASLVGGARLMVENAVSLAQALGISERVIAITVLAAGTSLPEFATSLVAAYKGREGLALGNVLGSNISNILFVLGGCSTIRPIMMSGMTVTDVIFFVGSVMLLFLVCFTRNKISRMEGCVLLLTYLAYICILFLQS